MKKGNLLITLLSVGCALFLFLLTGHESYAQEEDISKLRQQIEGLEERIIELEILLEDCREFQKEETSGEYGWQSKKNWRKLEKGMAESQVMVILGQPTKVIRGIKVLWYYPNIYGGYVSFDNDGKVAGWNEP